LDVDLKSKDLKKVSSRNHATLEYDHNTGSFIYINYGKNGSKINDNKQLKMNESALLRDGDRIQISSAMVILHYNPVTPV
jgi:predicted component of type VI protein secretion system